MHYFTSFYSLKPSERRNMYKAGFIVENDLFVKKDYGAFMINLPERIKTMKHFHMYDDFYKCNDYELLYYLENVEGYVFTIGPGAPNMDGEVFGNGLYCVNYRELIKKSKQKRR